MILTKNKTTTTKQQAFPLDYRGLKVYISLHSWSILINLMKTGTGQLNYCNYRLFNTLFDQFLQVVFLKMCFVKMKINFELLKLMIFFDVCYRNKPKNLSLNFIRLLRVVITPSVSKRWEEKTTWSNRMKFKLKNPGLLWQTVVGRAEHVHLINFTLPFSR